MDLAENVQWCGQGKYLEQRPAFTFDPLFHAGCYYVQEASSMFLEQVVRQYVGSPVLALDLCAAPGGKSTHLSSLLPEGSLLVSNEVIRSRAQVLVENMAKWGATDVVVTNNDPADFSRTSLGFDVILCDAPCSGEGMFRKDEVAITEWSEENVELCWQRQRRILSDIWPSLKEGGLLIYSTCTFNEKENEQNVAWVAHELGAEVLPVEIQPEWNIQGNVLSEDFPVYRFLPHRTKGEGLFMAVLRKTQGGNSHPPRIKKRKTDADKTVQQLGQWLHQADSSVLLKEENRIVLMPQVYVDEYAVMKQNLRVLSAGTMVAEQKGRDFIPSHALALSDRLSPSAFPRVEVSYEQAIQYLRREAVILSSLVFKGYVLLTYRDVPLGFVKNLGNRGNNLYPMEWRIRSTHTPSQPVEII